MLTRLVDIVFNSKQSIKAYGDMDVEIHTFLTPALAGEWSISRLGRFNPGQRAPRTHWIGGYVDLRAGLDDVEKILDPAGTRNSNYSVVQLAASRHIDYAIPDPSIS
jgi:hypothetical protein